MNGQKEAIINAIKKILPNFTVGVDNALILLSNIQLEQIKKEIKEGILNKTIAYSKDTTNLGEVTNYSRSCVMNHLKKAKELNGGFKMVTPAESGEPKTTRVKIKEAPKGVDPSLLPDDLKEFAKSLV